MNKIAKNHLQLKYYNNLNEYVNKRGLKNTRQVACGNLSKVSVGLKLRIIITFVFRLL